MVEVVAPSRFGCFGSWDWPVRCGGGSLERISARSLLWASGCLESMYRVKHTAADVVSWPAMRNLIMVVSKQDSLNVLIDGVQNLREDVIYQLLFRKLVS